MKNISDLVSDLYHQKPTSPLFHYTSLGSFLNIIKNRSLFATEVRYFSDSEEMNHAVGLLQRAINMRLESNATEFHQKLFKQLYQWLANRLKSGHLLFVISFTEKGNLLSQWRSYCQNAKGISFGFTPENLLASADQQSFQVGQCIYNIDKQKELVEELLNHIEILAQEQGENRNRNPLNSFHDVFESIEHDLLRIAVLMKNSHFHEEQEWRLISNIYSNYVEAPVDYREGCSFLIPYINFGLPKTKNRLVDIEAVWLGPTPNQNISMESISMFLSKQNASPRQGIYYSNVPYRTW